MQSNELFGGDDLVIHRNKKGEAIAGGFKVTSFIESAGQDMKKHSGGGLSVFKDLAVPAGLFLMQRASVNNFTTTNSEQVIDEKLYSNLVDLVDETPKTSQKKRNTRKSKGSKNKKGTRRRK
jgi:hypothetical protein